MLTRQDGLLNGRLRYAQPVDGFRSGIEPVLLAASVPARPGERVLEAGTGAGAALLCLHARVPDIDSVGVEIDPHLAALAEANAVANGFERMTICRGDLLASNPGGCFDHAIVNPPYHPAGTASPHVQKERAKRSAANLLHDWVGFLASRLQPRGTLTLALPAGAIPACLTALDAANCAGIIVFPLWPGAGKAAKLVLVRGVRGSKAPMTLASGLLLHERDGAFTAPTEAVLRGAEALPFG